MTRILKLEREIEELTRSELADLRQWFQEYDSAQWDKQIKEEALAGMFDKPAEKALADFQAGKAGAHGQGESQRAKR